MNNRGRFQAQGKVLEESEPWGQILPLYKDEGLNLISKLELKLSAKELKKRIYGFKKCKDFVNDSALNGGVNINDMGHPLIKSFPKNYIERVDIEVHKGIAFIEKPVDNEDI